MTSQSKESKETGGSDSTGENGGETERKFMTPSDQEQPDE